MYFSVFDAVTDGDGRGADGIGCPVDRIGTGGAETYMGAIPVATISKRIVIYGNLIKSSIKTSTIKAVSELGIGKFTGNIW